MEFWAGWFDHWGGKHVRRDAAEAARTLDRILALGASVNIYMLHGGTNFGFMNGASIEKKSGTFQPIVSSYDYDAPLDETGEPTAKFHAMREVIGRYAPLPPLPPPRNPRRLKLGPLRFAASASLLDAVPLISTPRRTVAPVPMEYLGQNHGFVLYRRRLMHLAGNVPLAADAVHDCAQLFVNGQPAGVLSRNGPLSLRVDMPGGEVQIDLLVENQGRVNYGPHLHDRKGLLGAVTLGGRVLEDWMCFPLPLDDLSALPFSSGDPGAAGPAFHRADFDIASPCDSFLALPGWTKGIAWINGFNLGRYWERGPQTALYIPGPVLRSGRNELIVLELHGAREHHVAWLIAERPD
jgi:beta-galactosidase